MRITASSAFDLPALRAFSRFAFYKRFPPIVYMIFYPVFFLFFLAPMTVAFLLSLFPPDRTSLLIFLWVIYAFLMLVHILYVRIFPASQRKSFEKLGIVSNCFVFENNRVHIESSGANISGSQDMDISAFSKIGESARYFYLFMPNRTAFIVDKLTIKGGSVDDFRAMLAVVPKQIRKLHL